MSNLISEVADASFVILEGDRAPMTDIQRGAVRVNFHDLAEVASERVSVEPSVTEAPSETMALENGDKGVHEFLSCCWMIATGSYLSSPKDLLHGFKLLVRKLKSNFLLDFRLGF